MKVYEVLGNPKLWNKRFTVVGDTSNYLYSFNEGILYVDGTCECMYLLKSIICKDVEFEKTRDEKYEELSDKKYTFYNFNTSIPTKLEVETTFASLKDSGRHTTLNFKISISDYDYQYIDLKFEDLETIYNFAKELKDL